MKRIIFSIMFILFFMSIVSAQSCFPEYKCGEWQDCIEGLQSRVCMDYKCNGKDIIERRFCEDLNCKPRVKCTDWTSCYYTDKIEDLFNAKIKFGGYKTRDCVDSAGCVKSFSEQGLCEEIYDLDIKKITYCGKEYMAISDPLSNKEIARINLDSWKKNKLDLTFSSGDSKYCPNCFNGIKDENEEQIDCGGGCRKCYDDKRNYSFLFMIFFWILTLLFFILLLRESVLDRKRSKNIFNEKVKNRVK